jgi:hypothetical protein
MEEADDKNRRLQDESEPVAPAVQRKGKRKYSKNLREVQEFERYASKAFNRMARSVEAGIREWRKQTDRSARRRRDGAIRDALDNFALATGKQMRVMSRVPEDVVDAVRALKIRRVVRRLLPTL